MRLFTLACLGFCTIGVLPSIVHAIDSKFAYDQSTSEAEQIGILEDINEKNDEKQRHFGYVANLANRHQPLPRRFVSDSLRVDLRGSVHREGVGGEGSSVLAGIRRTDRGSSNHEEHVSESGKVDQATVAPKPSPRQTGTVTWHKTKATFYGDPYDDGKRRVCADGKTVYKSDGLTCAAWTGGSGERIPLGTKIEVRRGNVSLILTVTDRQRSRTNRYLDLPTKTWAKLGAKYSVGKVAVEWRKL